MHGREGWLLLTTRAGRLLDQRDSLKAPHGTGKRGGFHAWRRFRFAVLRRAVVPKDLIKQWLSVGFACAYGSEHDRWGTKLDNLHISPSKKRKGIGTKLLADVASWSSKNYPGKGIFLWVFEQNLPARHFYEHLGGIITGDTLGSLQMAQQLKSCFMSGRARRS